MWSRLQARLSDDIEAKRREIHSLQHEGERLRSEASSILAEATESAERILHETNDTTQRVLHEAREAAGQIRTEAMEAADQIRTEATEAADQVRHQATADAEDMRREAAQKIEMANSLLSRVRGLADDFLATSAAEVQSLGGGDAVNEQRDGEPQVREASEEPPEGARMDVDDPEPADEGEPVGDDANQAAITRMVIHPLVGTDSRNRVKERFERLSEIKAVKLGAVNDDCFELLIIHQRDAKILDSVVGIAPRKITLKQQKAGYIELELKEIDWLDEVAV